MATIYISPTGNDTTGNGTISTPYLTITKSLSVGSAGDTCYCLDGTYTMEELVVNKVFTITGSSPSRVIFDGSIYVGREIQATDSCTISNIKFQNHTRDSYSAFITISGDNKNLTVSNCIFDNIIETPHPSAYGGIIGALETTVSLGLTITVNSCIFSNISTAGIAGTTNGCIFFLGNAGTHITFIAKNNTVSISLIAGNWIRGIFSSWGPVVIDLLSVQNNIFYNISGNTVYHFSAGVPVPNWESYNDWYLITYTPTGAGDITSDPLFVDAPNGNFNLRQTSPCLDTGVLI